MKIIASISLIITLILTFALLPATIAASAGGLARAPILTPLLLLLNIILAIQALRGRSALIKAISIINFFLLFIFLIIIGREIITDGYAGGRDALANLLTVLYFAANAYLYPLMKKRDKLALLQKGPDIFK